MSLEVPAGIPAEARDRFQELLHEPLMPPEVLLKEVDDCVGMVRRVVMEGAPLDVTFVEGLADRARAMVGRAGTDAPEADRRMVQAAVRYFVLSDDAEGDLVSLMGFDDDALVLDAVAAQLSR